jgi:hypothetical protein
MLVSGRRASRSSSTTSVRDSRPGSILENLDMWPGNHDAAGGSGGRATSAIAILRVWAIEMARAGQSKTAERRARAGGRGPRRVGPHRCAPKLWRIRKMPRRRAMWFGRFAGVRSVPRSEAVNRKDLALAVSGSRNLAQWLLQKLQGEQGERQPSGAGGGKWTRSAVTFGFVWSSLVADTTLNLMPSSTARVKSAVRWLRKLAHKRGGVAACHDAPVENGEGTVDICRTCLATVQC